MTVKVIFVCLGNICRSPMADAVFQKMVDEAGLSEKVTVDSAGMWARKPIGGHDAFCHNIILIITAVPVRFALVTWIPKPTLWRWTRAISMIYSAISANTHAYTDSSISPAKTKCVMYPTHTTMIILNMCTN